MTNANIFSKRIKTLISSTLQKPLKIYDRLQRELEIDEINEGVF